MYRQIVVPLDGSTFAEAALPLALALSTRTKATLHLVTVVEPIPAFSHPKLDPAPKEWSEEYLSSVRERISGYTGAEVTTAFRTGQVVETLLAETRAREADVVVSPRGPAPRDPPPPVALPPRRARRRATRARPRAQSPSREFA